MTAALNDPFELDEARLARAREALAHLSEIRSPSRSACPWCGVSHAPRWHPSPWSWPNGEPGRNSQWYFCHPCFVRWRSSRGDHRRPGWRGHMAAEWLQLPLTPIELLDTTLQSYREVTGADRAGTPRRWQFLEGVAS